MELFPILMIGILLGVIVAGPQLAALFLAPFRYARAERARWEQGQGGDDE